jgi:hypothetical protein
MQKKQPWRAATLLGGVLYDDPQLSSAPGAHEAGGPGGNQFRFAWLHACHAIAEVRHAGRCYAGAEVCVQNARSVQEKALYGLQCGSLQHVVGAPSVHRSPCVLTQAPPSGMCRDWEDLVWAHFCCMIDRNTSVARAVLHQCPLCWSDRRTGAGATGRCGRRQRRPLFPAAVCARNFPSAQKHVECSHPVRGACWLPT